MIGKRFLCAALLAVPLLVAAPAHAYVYWADPASQTIGRANNDGSGANDAFIHAGQLPFAVAVDASHIYWANQEGGSIGRANIDGSEVNNSFIAGIAQPSGVAVNNLSPPPTPTPTPPAPEPAKPESALQLGALKRNLKKGTALMTVDVGGAGTLTLSGKGVTKVTKAVQRMGFAKLAVKAKGGARKTLLRTGKVSLKVTVLFAQTGDTPTTRSRSVVLKHAG